MEENITEAKYSNSYTLNGEGTYYISDNPCLAQIPADAVYDQNAKADDGKPMIMLVPPQIIRDIAEVREYGNKKYGDPDNWKTVEIERYFNALLRHTLLFMDDPYGKDDESGIEHYKHMACNMAFICEMMKEKHIRE